ncbi:uncharacterized protein LAESUDRAFT_731808 [Laetiporus sulphureus 93-53]|uniref:PH domain-containing protein n=1 Tax=Laetiporus sulphureus 93-53 TaxID=1314785 RepID=A0A165BEF7_9APHY|nr:uncharacterized protein LAESUDRAFT_731808 [Laetiporus sulphureus 93-53]KZT00876.1 hypothetical protein LAESUDRAFT_731808 [Laetiporus sulphureus 93-53]
MDTASTIRHDTSLGGTDYLYQVKLLSALRSGDPARIHTFISELGQERRSSDGNVDLSAAALHLAIRCASTDTVALLLSYRSVSPNGVYPPGSGTTPLHLAASIPRVDVVNLLLEQDGIDDTLRDSEGRTCLDIAKGRETVRAIQDSRALLNASYRSFLRSYILSATNNSPPEGLVKLLSSPRVQHVDLSYLDDTSGVTLLHEAARRKDLKLIELAIRAGADVFARDRRGRAVSDVVGKDDRLKAFLRQYTNQDRSLLPATTSEPPELKGYLNKYTNVAKGYNIRWFVLKDGVLSYYRHQDDENVSCRGSIAMKTATLNPSPGNSGLRFEVHSAPTRGRHGQKWYLKASHRVEAARWIQALQQSTEWAKREGELVRKSGDSEAPSHHASVRSNLSNVHLTRIRSAVNGIASAPSSIAEADEEPGDETGSPLHGSGEEHSSMTGLMDQRPPHDASFQLQGNALLAHVELTSQLLAQLPVEAAPGSRAAELKKALEETTASVRSIVAEYIQMVRDREEWWKAQLQRERERQSLWEESLQMVVKEGQALEQELKKKSRRRSRVVESSYGTTGGLEREGSTVRRRASQLVTTPEAEMETDTAISEQSPTPTGTTTRRPSSRQLSVISPVQSILAAYPSRQHLRNAPAEMEDTESFVDTDEEDEFFDAIESNALPNLIILQPAPEHLWLAIHHDQYIGYLRLRERLAIDHDDRPPMSLWAVLKNSIGKDLTRISFPVFFNEPTSMLQRMAEDMEFSECLDSAYAETDPHRRIAFVAAFAMSNYSSTIGRIAKPFNPMLSETFEYVRLDKDYRYMSEQVSHHPPISACWAESPHWRYYGEVDAQNRFMGKSFEIRPTGVAHAELLLPEERAPSYPKAKGAHVEGKVIEHYSWKKVTTNVSGFILGSPTIDHYGDMVITNHRTGDKCVLTFKPRGWRGKDAYEICGYVEDSSGTMTLEIAGRWNSQLVARVVGTGYGQLHPDVDVDCADCPSEEPQYILLWRNSEKPPAPFNLTPFAITLNDCPPTLGPYVAPTDCRLRPDQRAFEIGKYEYANDLKNKQEEFQRAIRRAREEGRLPPHRPRWFTARTEADTGERVWEPAKINEELEYWIERDKIWDAKQKGKSVSWKGVDRIFIEDTP